MLASDTPKDTPSFVALPPDVLRRFRCLATNKKASTRLAFLLRWACRLRFASPAQAETGETEAKKSKRPWLRHPAE